MEVKVIKQWNGCIDLRDFVVKRCIKDNEDCIVKHAGRKMKLTPEELKTKKVSESSTTFPSQYGNPPYKLYQYEWDPIDTDY